MLGTNVRVRLLDPGAGLIDALAQAILDGAAPPDLSRQVVLVADFGAAPNLRAALGRAAAARGYAALFAPRITTLQAWVAEASLERDVMGGRERLARLYTELKALRRFDGAGLWDIAQAILATCDELTLACEPGEATVESLQAALKRAYRGRADANAQFEAQLVIKVWRALAADAVHGSQGQRGALDPAMAWRLQLSRTADAADAPLWVLDHRPPASWPVHLRDFVVRAARRVPVTLLGIDTGAPAFALAGAAWPAATAAPLRERASGLLPVRVPRLVCATSLEAEARAVAAQVRAWVAEGKRDIAIVALDRMTARRARALLERDAILVADEAGWKLSTTSAATALMRWLDCASAGFRQGDLVDLLRSPFMFGDLGEDVRKQVAATIDGVIRADNLLGGLAALTRALVDAPLTASAARAGVAALARLDQAARQLDVARGAERTMQAWFERLAASLATIGLDTGLARDIAGVQVRDTLGELERDAQRMPGRYAWREWRQWLEHALEDAGFRDTQVMSPVLLTQLSRLAFRRFDGVVVIGADAAHLPARVPSPLFLAERLRAELGLIDAAARAAELRADLMHLIAVNDAVCITWRGGVRDEANAPSPYVVMLDAAHVAAFGASLIEPCDVAGTPTASMNSVPTGVRAAPRAGTLFPAMLSASALNSLIACPYQFFARHLLGLNQPDAVREELEKRDYGQWVHRVLHLFHQRHPVISDLAHDDLLVEMQTLADEVFAPAITFNYLSLGWKLRFMQLAPLYLKWQGEWEKEGWRFKDGEVAVSRELPLKGGGGVMLKGRLDRIDAITDLVTGEQHLAVIDYKTQSQQVLRDKLKRPGEDVQLPVYALLAGDAVATAVFLGLERDKVGHQAPATEIQSLAHAEADRLATTLGAIRAGAPLPAHGAERVCSVCEMRGLCRRDYVAGLA